VKDADPGYAIMRVDLGPDEPDSRVSVLRVVWSEEVADAETRRLNDLNADKGCRYFWQYTRVDRREPRET